MSRKAYRLLWLRKNCLEAFSKIGPGACSTAGCNLT